MRQSTFNPVNSAANKSIGMAAHFHLTVQALHLKSINKNVHVSNRPSTRIRSAKSLFGITSSAEHFTWPPSFIGSAGGGGMGPRENV